MTRDGQSTLHHTNGHEEERRREEEGEGGEGKKGADSKWTKDKCVHLPQSSRTNSNHRKAEAL